MHNEGATVHIPCGRVWFTVSVEPWVEGKEPTEAEVALRLTGVIVASVVLHVVGLVLAGTLSGCDKFQRYLLLFS